ncbi:MAG: ComF family protein [Planctomycetes bacterium]|nr:ComF family protein [Planctomycetota bacterium]
MRFSLEGFHHLLWPAICSDCRTSISENENVLCGDCWGELLLCSGGNYCRRCGKDASEYGMVEGICPDCQGREIHFDGIARSGIYGDSLKRLILAFKKGRCELDEMLGSLGNSALEGGGFYDEIDFFVPVPLHWTRRFSRGFNQSLILAKKLKHPTAKIGTDLVRIRRTIFQAATSTTHQRIKNVAGAFGVRLGHRFEGRSICLVDDIKTSGATLNECAKTLKEGGAGKVFALVLAVADQHAI